MNKKELLKYNNPKNVCESESLGVCIDMGLKNNEKGEGTRAL